MPGEDEANALAEDDGLAAATSSAGVGFALSGKALDGTVAELLVTESSPADGDAAGPGRGL